MNKLDLSYEEAVEELEQILKDLESGELSLRIPSINLKGV